MMMIGKIVHVRKAFDAIDHSILLKKLLMYGLDNASVNWFKSYLSERAQKTKVNGHLSGFKQQDISATKDDIFML